MTDLYCVTGTTRGLGAAIVAALREREGVLLVTLSRRDADIEADLGHAAGIHAACGSIAKRLAGQSFAKAVLINNAGVVDPVGPLATLDAHAVARNISVNLTAPMLITQAFLQATASSGLRRVINISSGAARRPIDGWGPYCATKAALDMATRTLALEATARGERIEAVSLAPGVIDTDMQATIRGVSAERFRDVERFREMKVQGVLRSAEEVAADILELEASGALFQEAVGDLRALKPA